MALRYVNAYDTNRSYGGPEEGGWWYGTGRLMVSTPCLTDEDVERAKEVLSTIYGPTFEGNHDIGSVLCEGKLSIVVEDGPGEDYPTERPHYE